MMQTFSITTLGCKVNQYDGQAVAATLGALGLRRASEGETPDLAVVNTCCVTATAMRKSRQTLRRAVRTLAGGAVCVVGCYSDYDRRRIVELLGEMGVAGQRMLVAGHHDDLPGKLKTFVNARRSDDGPADSPAAPPSGDVRSRRIEALGGDAGGTRGLTSIDRFADHQRAFVKVQDGCDAFCTYCIVPYTRCRVWSRPVGEVVDECRRLVSAGHREIVLSGVFLGAYGRRTAVRRRWTGAGKLAGLLRTVAAIDGLWRVRLSSIEPGDLTDELLGACRELPGVAPHLHLPLQSGSGEVLRRMNRQYTPDAYRRTIDRLGEAMDRPALTTDIIVGFPGETDAAFGETLAMVRHAGFARVHAFPFSAIRPTAAWKFRREAPDGDVVKARMRELTALADEQAMRYRRQFVGERVEGLIERARTNDGDVRRAMTDRYQTVRFPAPPGVDADALTGCVVNLTIAAADGEGLVGVADPSATA